MNEEQRQAALLAMTDWLVETKELDRARLRIECRDEFDLYHQHYYLFRFKTSRMGKWLLGVCGGYEEGSLTNNGQIASELAEYRRKNALANAIAMVEAVREYWIAHAREELEKRETPPEPVKTTLRTNPDDRIEPFVGYVLLDSPTWNPEQLRTALRADWELDVPDGPPDAAALACGVGEMLVAVTYLAEQIPDGQAELYAGTNPQWQQAMEVAQTHQAHIMVVVIGRGQPPIEVGKLFVKVCDACLQQPNATALLATGTLHEPGFYRRAAAVINTGDLPVFNWVYFGLYQTATGKLNAYTFGMGSFGRDELEVLESTEDAQELRNLLFNVCYYELSEDIFLSDGSTIAYTDDKTLSFRLSRGIALEVYTLKINYVRGLDIGA